MLYRLSFKDEHRTSNVQRWTSNKEIAPLGNLISFVFQYPLSNLKWLFLFLFSPSTPLRAVSLLKIPSLSRWSKIPSLSRWSNGHFDTRHRYRTSFGSLLQDDTLASSSFFSFNIRCRTLDVGRSMFDVHPFSVRCSFFQFLPHKNNLALMGRWFTQLGWPTPQGPTDNADRAE